MSSYNIIGGEFEIADSQCVRNTPPHPVFGDKIVYSYSSGRAALYNICKALQGKISKVLLPDYLCYSIPATIEKSGIAYEYYTLNSDLEPDVDSVGSLFEDVGTAVLVIDYFGCVDTSKVISSIKNTCPSAVIILDDVQSPFTIGEPSEADYLFTSFRKAYPVSDGAYVVTSDNSLSQPTVRSKFAQYKLAGELLKKFRDEDYYEDNVYLSLLSTGEELIDNDLDTDMCDHAKKVMSILDVGRIKTLRRRNVEVILDGLRSLSIKTLLDIPDGRTPLFVPITLHNRDEVRRDMFGQNIFCPVHWPIEKDGDRLVKGTELSRTELSLIIDQRYSMTDMHRILDILEKTK